MEAGECPNQPVHGLAKSASKAGGSSRGSARVHEVIVDLPPHAVHLLMHGFGDFASAGRRRSVGFVCDDRERSLQAVRKITGFADGAFDGPIALIEQRVEIVYQRLHLGGVCAFESARAASVQDFQIAANGIHRRQTAPHLKETGEHECTGNDDRQVALERSMDASRGLWM